MFDFLFPPPKPPGPKTLFDGTVTRFLGKCFLGVACLGLVLVAGILFVGYTSGSPQTRAVCGLLVVILGVPTVGLAIAGGVNTLVGMGLYNSARQRVVSVLKGYGYVRIRDLAQEMDLTETSLEQFISKCVTDGTLGGRLDPTGKEYWSETEQEYAEFASYVRAYRRIKLDALAQKMGKTEFEVEKMLKHALQRGMLHGYIDRFANEFMTSESIDHVEASIICPQCGAPEDRMMLRGEQRLCDACGSAL